MELRPVACYVCCSSIGNAGHTALAWPGALCKWWLTTKVGFCGWSQVSKDGKPFDYVKNRHFKGSLLMNLTLYCLVLFSICSWKRSVNCQYAGFGWQTSHLRNELESRGKDTWEHSVPGSSYSKVVMCALTILCLSGPWLFIQNWVFPLFYVFYLAALGYWAPIFKSIREYFEYTLHSAIFPKKPHQ